MAVGMACIGVCRMLLSAFLISFLFCVPTALGASVVSAAASDDMLMTLDSLSRVPLAVLNEKGEQAFHERRDDEALRIYSVICRRHGSDAAGGDARIFASAFDRLGNTFYRRGAYSLAMDSYLKARSICEECGFSTLLARVYGNIGNLYASSGDYDRALHFYRRSLSQGGTAGQRSMAINNIFIIFCEQGRLDSARLYHARYVREGSRDVHYDFDVAFGQGMLLDRSGKTDSALLCFRKCLELGRRGGLSPLSEGGVYSYMSSSYERRGLVDSAIIYGKKAWKIAEKGGNRRLVVETWKELSRQYQLMGRSDSSLEYKGAYLALADSIPYQEEVNKLRTSQMVYELDASSSKIDRLNADKRRQWQIILTVSVVALVLVGMAFVLSRQNKRLRRAWRELYDKNENRLNEEREYKARIASLEAELLSDRYPASLGKVREDFPGELPEPDARRKNLVDKEKKDLIMRQIMRIMEETEDFCSLDFSIDSLAASIDSNTRYVSEVINDVMHKNFRAMLNEYRVKKAMARLSDAGAYGQYTIKAISESVGYRSQATFISVFTRHTGLKPSMYQKLAREKGNRDVSVEEDVIC